MMGRITHLARDGGPIARSGLAAALLLMAGCAADPPSLQEGLWEVHGQTIEKPANTTATFAYQLCRDHLYDKAATAQMKNVKGCSTLFKKVGDGKFSSASTCVVADTTIVSNGLTTFRSPSATHSEARALYAPALGGKTDETLIEDQTYVGKCPRGMRAGDTMNSDGIVLHHGA